MKYGTYGVWDIDVSNNGLLFLIEFRCKHTKRIFSSQINITPTTKNVIKLVKYSINRLKSEINKIDPIERLLIEKHIQSNEKEVK